MLKSFTLRIQHRVAFRNLRFQYEGDDADSKWELAVNNLDVDDVLDDEVFFNDVIKHFKSYGFIHTKA